MNAARDEACPIGDGQIMSIGEFRERVAHALEQAWASRSLRIAVPSIFAALVAVFLWGQFSKLSGDARPESAPQQGVVSLTAEQQRNANVSVAPIARRPLREVFRAPGEVQTNGYTAGIVAPRVTATVVARNAQLGDTVKQGQPLVTLYSQDVAEAQSAYMLASSSLARLTRIRAVIAEQQIDEARAKVQEAHGRLESYGLTDNEISQIAREGLGRNHPGHFAMVSPAGGKIIEDNFKVGDVVEAGKALFQIADLRDVWIEGHVSPLIAPKLAGTGARVLSGDSAYAAQIVQQHDTVDETTRTVGVRLKLSNPDRSLRPGQFVDIEFYGAPQNVLAIPAGAVLRNAAGHSVIFVRQPDGAFQERPVKVLFIAGTQAAVEGVAAGTPVVTGGAFFVMSEAAKAGFGEDE